MAIVKTIMIIMQLNRQHQANKLVLYLCILMRLKKFKSEILQNKWHGYWGHQHMHHPLANCITWLMFSTDRANYRHWVGQSCRWQTTATIVNPFLGAIHIKEPQVKGCFKNIFLNLSINFYIWVSSFNQNALAHGFSFQHFVVS